MPIQNFVSLEPIKHQYFDLDGKEYASVSRVTKEYSNDPDWDAIAGKVAGRGKFAAYPTKEAVLKLWKDNANQAMDFGTAWHNDIENYIKLFKLPEDTARAEVIKEIASHYKDFYRVESEATLYHPEYMVAGTSDKVLIPKKGGKYFMIADYKTALKTGGIDYDNKDDVYMLHPVDHLQSCKFVKYSLQLSIYAVMMERLTGLKCKGMWITFIADGKPLQRIYVNYLKNEALALLEHYHAKKNTVVVAKLMVEEDAPDFIE